MEGHWWSIAQRAALNSAPGNITQNVPRAWEFSHCEIGGFSFEQEDHFKHSGLSSESVQFTTAGEDEISYTLADEGIEGMYWWRDGLRYVRHSLTWAQKYYSL